MGDGSRATRFNVDLSLRRMFAISERVKLQVAADASNLLNHAELSGAFNGGLGNTNLTSNRREDLFRGTATVPRLARSAWEPSIRARSRFT